MCAWAPVRVVVSAGAELAEIEPVDEAPVAVIEEVVASGEGITRGPDGMEDSENRIAD